MYTTDEVAALFRVGVPRVRAWAAAGKLPAIRTPGGGQWRFPRAEVDALLRRPEQ